MATAERLPGREHIPRYPGGWIVLRIFQLIFALAALGISAYGIVVSAYASGGLMIFVAIDTIIVTIWLICAHSCAPRAFNYWACLVLDIFLYIFWLSSFALMSVAAAAHFAIRDDYDDDYYDGDYYYDDDYYDGYDWSYWHTGGIVLAVGAAIGACNFLFFFIALVTDAVVIYRHRRAGLHSRPVNSAHVAGGMPVQMQPQTKPVYTAVPQQGIPFTQQDTAYSPQHQQMYSPPPQQQQQPYQVPQQQPPAFYAPSPQQPTPGYYGIPQQQVAPLAPQQTGGSYKATSPAPSSHHGPYEAPLPYAPHHAATPPQPQPYQYPGHQ